ncbi:LysR family transcriptional regulator [Antarcticimicrobium sediminis]|nr:LysR family transcriptional regulator [Antarcticimicrobium sediminis]
MHWSSIRFDWNQARAFLVTAEEGSLSAAARALGMTQPTLGRQVAALEETLGVQLFDRTGRALQLTTAGQDLLEQVRRMGEAAGQFSLIATGQSKSIEGHVTITASDVVATSLLPPALTRLARLAPGITIEVVASNEVQNLRRREADIAIRHVRPDQPDLIARKLKDDAARCYATGAYLDRFGEPTDLGDLSGAIFAGYEPVDRFLCEMQTRGLAITRKNIRFSSASGVMLFEMVRRGEAIGVMTQELASLIRDARPILPAFPPIPVPFWLVSHRELRTNRRIRLVFNLLAKELSR